MKLHRVGKKERGECWCSRIASPYPRASVERRALPCPSGDRDLTTTPVVCESLPQAQRGRLPLPRTAEAAPMCGRASSRQAQSRLIRRQGGDGDPRRARRRLNYRRDKHGGDRHPSNLHFMTGGGEGDGLRRLIRRQGGDGDPRPARSRLIHRHGGDGNPRRTTCAATACNRASNQPVSTRRSVKVHTVATREDKI